MTSVAAERARDHAPAGAPRWSTFVWASLLAGAFLLRIPGIVEPLGMDQGIFATAGWGLRRGLVLYRDLWDQKPPGLHLSYQLAFVLFGERATSVFWLDYGAAVLTALLLFDLGRRAINARFGAMVAAVFALGTLPAARYALGGFLERAIAETFISMFAAAAAWATFRTTTRAGRAWPFVAGVFIGIASVFKPTALVYWPAFVAWVWLIGGTGKAIRYALSSVAGALVAPLGVTIWLWSHAALQDAWIAVVQYNLVYAAGGQRLLGWADRFVHEVWRRLKTDEVWLLGSIGAVAAFCGWRSRKNDRGAVAWLGLCWLGASLVGAAANGAYTLNTYFLPPLVPLCLLAAWLLECTLASGRRWKVAIGVLLLAATGAMAVRSGSIVRAASMTAWDARYLFGVTGQQEYLARFRSRSGHGFSAADNALLADYVRAHTDPQDRIYVFGMTAGTYFMSGRLPANRFLWVYPGVSHLVDRPEFYVDALAQDLARTAPRYLILQRYNRNSFTGWRVEDDFAAPSIIALLRRYQRETEIGDFVLYRRVGSAH